MNCQEICKEIRRRSGLTQDAFALKSGIPQTTWSQYETGKRQPDPRSDRLDKIIIFAKKLGMKIKKSDLRPDIFK